MDLTEFDSIQTEAEFLIASFRQRYGFPVAPPVPVEMIAEALCGLRREFRRLGNARSEILGALSTEERLILADDRCARRQRYVFTVAHEVGHWVLHEGNGSCHVAMSEPLPVTNLLGSMSAKTKKDRTRLREVEANRFAGALLMPRFFLMGEAEAFQLMDKAAIAELARVFDVSMAAMLFRIKDLKKHLEWAGPAISWNDFYRLEDLLNRRWARGGGWMSGDGSVAFAREQPGGSSERQHTHLVKCASGVMKPDGMQGLRYLSRSSRGKPWSQSGAYPLALDHSRAEGRALNGSLADIAGQVAQTLECGFWTRHGLHRHRENVSDARRGPHASEEPAATGESGAPIIIEFGGTPKSGKDKLIPIIKDYLEDGHGYRVRVFDEAIKFCHIGRQLTVDRLFKTVAQTVAQLYEARFENPGDYDFVIFNRGLFDRVAFVRAMWLMGEISAEQERVHRDYLLSYAGLQDMTFLFLISEDESLRRDRAKTRDSVQELYAQRDGKGEKQLRRQNILEKKTLKHLNESYLTMFAICKESFNNQIYLFDFTQGADASIMEKARALVDATLPRDSSQLLLPELFGVYYGCGGSSRDEKRARGGMRSGGSLVEPHQPLLLRVSRIAHRCG